MGCGPSKAAPPEADLQEENEQSPSASLRRQSLGGSSEPRIRLNEVVQLSFERVMASDAGIKAMIAFAERELSDENIRFFAAVEGFRKTAAADDVEDLHPSTIESAMHIIDTYLCTDAEYLVKRSPSTAHTILKVGG